MKQIINILFLILLSSSLVEAQCGNFNNSISPSFYPMGNTCNGIPTNTVEICATIVINFSSGNASFQYGYMLNGIKTPASLVLNTSGNTPLSTTLCFRAPCSAAVQFYITAWSNPNGGGSVCTQANASVTSVSVTPLPVELGSFEVHPKGNGNLISWMTYTETNNDYFNIEKSKNGQTWEFLARIKGNGNSHQELSYSYLDKDAFGMTYYRLKQFDFDGTVYISDVIKLKSLSSQINRVTIFPNPVTERLYFSHNLDDQIIIQKVTSSIGIVIDHLLITNDGLDVSNLSTGTYFLHYTMNEENFIHRIIKI